MCVVPALIYSLIRNNLNLSKSPFEYDQQPSYVQHVITVGLGRFIQAALIAVSNADSSSYAYG